MYTPINGFTKQSMIKVIEREFKGKAVTEAVDGTPSRCVYLNNEGKKCAVGCFIPDGHEALKFGEGARSLVARFWELKLPLPVTGLIEFQETHDYMRAEHFEEQKQVLIDWINSRVA